MVDLRLELRGTDGRRELQVFRMRLLRGGWDRPRMLILAAPALDAPPLGLGYRSALNGHHLPGLGITLERVEADLGRNIPLRVHAAAPGGC